jgi:hypothetical protein
VINRPLIAAVASVVVTAVTAGVTSSRPGTPSQKDVVRLAADYVAEYQRQLTAIVADEEYAQRVRRDPQEAGVTSRTTAGEVFFIFTEAGRGWMAIRDVRTVDGAPVAERADVREILRTLPAGQVADRMRSYNARFNIGRITRNINEPTLALLSLDEGHRSRFRFSTTAREARDGRELIWLAFQERDRPTLIRGLDRATIFVKGKLLVEASNGRIWESRLTTTVDGLNVELTTEYRFDERLGLMLPAVFREHYAREKRAGAFEAVDCEATYSNFRRFEVSARIR